MYVCAYVYSCVTLYVGVSSVCVEGALCIMDVCVCMYKHQHVMDVGCGMRLHWSDSYCLHLFKVHSSRITFEIAIVRRFRQELANFSNQHQETNYTFSIRALGIYSVACYGEISSSPVCPQQIFFSFKHILLFLTT